MASRDRTASSPLEDHGDLLVPDMDGTGFYEVSLRTRTKTLVGAGFDHPMFLNFGAGGFLYVADEARIWRFEPDGSKTPIAGNGTRGLAGDGGPATSAQLGGHGDSPSMPPGTSTSRSTTTASGS